MHDACMTATIADRLSRSSKTGSVARRRSLAYDDKNDQ
jgi:hypothetical protein